MAEENSKQKQERLERKLRAIQELKSEQYIGTQDAYDYLKDVQKIYSVPEKTAEVINKRLSLLEPITYPSTPERIVGLAKAISGLSFEVEINEEYIENIPNISDIAEKSPFLKALDFINYLESSFNDVKETTKNVSCFFAYANTEEIKSDKDFGDIVVKLMEDSYNKIKKDIDRNFLDNYDNFMHKFLTKLSNIDWRYQLSKDNFRNLEREEVKVARSRIRLSTIIERIFRDKLDHKLEYRRQTLCRWLEKFSDAGLNADYEIVLKNAELQVRARKKCMERLKRFDYPEQIIKDLERLARNAKFIRHLVGADKNFIKRYLEH